jgi:hypothetical protein
MARTDGTNTEGHPIVDLKFPHASCGWTPEKIHLLNDSFQHVDINLEKGKRYSRQEKTTLISSS